MMVEKWYVVAKWFGFSDCARTYTGDSEILGKVIDP